jgi:hypothetical protein
MISPMRGTRVAMGFAGAFAFAAALWSGAALAQSPASCKQEYAAKKIAGEAGGQTQASYVRACLAVDKVARAPQAQGSMAVGAAPAQSGADSSADLAKQLANPIARSACRSRTISTTAAARSALARNIS